MGDIIKKGEKCIIIDNFGLLREEKTVKSTKHYSHDTQVTKCIIKSTSKTSLYVQNNICNIRTRSKQIISR